MTATVGRVRPELESEVRASAGAGPNESSSASIAWAAIIAGALAIGSCTVILVALGSGLGFATVSPWPHAGPSATTFTVMTAIWLIIVQWLSSALGGYVAGRTRTKWVGIHNHEVYFRDTISGFLAWALATVVGVAVLASAAASLTAAASRGVAAMATPAAAVAARSGETSGAGGATGGESGTAGTTGPSAYFVDTLFRTDNPGAQDRDARGEAARIVLNGLRTGDIPPPDKAYLARMVAARTGLSDTDAQKRVDDVVAQVKDAETKARQAADSARKAGAALSIFTALSMIIGAFIAAAAAALGGIHRDQWSERLRTV